MAEFEKNGNNGADEFEEYEPEIIDLDGESFEIIDALEADGVNYVALTPYIEDVSDEDDDSSEIEFVILKEVEDENGEHYLSSIEDEKLYDEIGDKFLAHFEELYNEE